MDIKTLEYMAERVDEGKDIQQQIEDNKCLIDELEASSNDITRMGLLYDGSYKKDFFVVDRRTIRALKDKMIEAAEERIKKLEERFAEL